MKVAILRIGDTRHAGAHGRAAAGAKAAPLTTVTTVRTRLRHVVPFDCRRTEHGPACARPLENPKRAAWRDGSPAATSPERARRQRPRRRRRRRWRAASRSPSGDLSSVHGAKKAQRARGVAQNGCHLRASPRRAARRTYVRHTYIRRTARVHARTHTSGGSGGARWGESTGKERERARADRASHVVRRAARDRRCDRRNERANGKDTSGPPIILVVPRSAAPPTDRDVASRIGQ